MVKGRKTFTKKGFGRRILSMALAFVMSFTMFAAELPFGLLAVKAEGAPTNVTLHFNNSNWNWGEPAIQYWQFGDVTASGYASGPTEISGWGGAQGYTLADEGAGWYSITLTGNIEGFQFLDMSNPANNTGGKGYHGAMGLYTADTPQDLYYKEDTGEWYLEATYTTLLDYPEDAASYDVIVHYYNDNKWDAVAAWVWNGSDNYTGGTWPGVVLEENAEKANWYDW